jgi:predicted ATPase
VQQQFHHGACFVPLQDVTMPAGGTLVAAVADALGVPLLDTAEFLPQIVAYLAGKELLLILDNFEHCLDAGGAEFAAGLLADLPDIKLLITSRAALNLLEEWRYPLAGMPAPTGGAPSEIESSAIVQLFADCARRAQGHFSLAEEWDGVAAICRLVDGMPLAVELAALWTATLPCSAIAAELARNLRILHSSMRDVPERHRSIQAVFDQSWMLLADEERSTLARLSVLRGGFTPAAARRQQGRRCPCLRHWRANRCSSSSPPDACVCRSCCDSMPKNGWQLRRTERRSARATVTPHTLWRSCRHAARHSAVGANCRR